MQRRKSLQQRNVEAATKVWGNLSDHCLRKLEHLTAQFPVSVESGDLQLLENSWYITHGGLLRVARASRCNGISTEIVPELSLPASGRWVVKAIVYKSPRSRGFVGYGDADPSNVSPAMHGAELRIAETRAVNRALRKAYGIGLCSVEELGAGGTSRASGPIDPADNHHGNGQPRLRDRLLLFIRQYQLDTEQVKLYAAHSCGTASLRETSREQIQSFLDHLATLAAQGRDTLVAEIASVSRTRKSNGDESAAQATHKEAA